MQLTKDQETALAKIQEFLNDSNKTVFGFFGYGGTGKTTLLNRIVKRYEGQVLNTASTNKATSVMKYFHKNFGSGTNEEFTTTYKLFGYKLVPTYNAEEDEWEDKMVKSNMWDFPFDDQGIYPPLVVIDESSMIPEWFYSKLLDYADEFNLKILFVGDSGQLPPVKEKISPVFALAEKEDTHVLMKEIVRQSSGSKILQVATEIRNDILREKFDFSTILSKEHILKTREELGEKAIEYFKKNNDFTDTKIIAWRNKTVNWYNTYIRSSLRGPVLPKECPFIVGDPVVSKRPVYKGLESVLYTSQEMIIQSITESARSGIKTYAITLKSKYEPKVTVHMVKPTNYKTYLSKCKYYKTKAQRSDDSRDWAIYRQFAYGFAELDFSYAITSHRCLPLNSKIITSEEILTLDKFADKEIKVISGSNNQRKVTNYIKTGDKKKYYINTACNKKFISSKDHKYLTPDGSYKKAEEIEIGDYLCIWRNPNQSQFQFDLNYYGYGYLVGDGCYNYKSNRVDISILPSSSNIHILRRFLGQYGSKVYLYKRKNNKAIIISTENKQFREHLLKIGLGRTKSPNKITPILKTINQKANYIRGLMDADGSCSKKSALIRLVNTSEEIIDDAAIILLQFGIVARKTIQIPNKRKENVKFTLSIYSKDCIRYLNQIGFSIKYKQRRLKKVCKKISAKTNIDIIPKELGIKEQIRNLLTTSKKIGTNKDSGMLGKAGSASNSQTIRAFFRQKHLSYYQLEVLVKILKDRKITVPPLAVNILKNWYFYDQVTESYLTEEITAMADIEVEKDHNFIYNGAVVHNSQGSTYKNVFIDAVDICDNPNIEERNKCLYVAASRPTNSIYIKQ